jgi:hypothetical protein
MPERCVTVMLYWGKNQPHESVDRAKLIGKTLMQSTHQGIKELSLSRNLLQDPGGVSLSKMLAFNTGLEKLTLDDNLMTDNTLVAMAVALMENKEGSSLKMLSLARNKIGRLGCKMLGNLLRASHKVTEIDLASNELDDDSVSHLIEAMKCNSVVIVLNIPNNPKVSSHLKDRLDELVAQNNDRPSKKAKIVKCKADGHAVVTKIGVVLPTRDEL